MVIAVFFLFFFQVQTRAADLTLVQAIEEAQHNSPQVQKAHSFYEEMSWKHNEYFSVFLPKITGDASYLLNKKYMVFQLAIPGSPPNTVPQIVPNAIFSLNATWAIFDGFSGINNYRASDALKTAAEADYRWSLFSVQRQIALQFYRTLATQTLREVAEQNLKTLQDHLKDVSLFKKAGISTNYDVLRVEVQVSEAQTELMSATDEEVMSKNKFSEILGKEVEDRNLKGQLPVLDSDRGIKLKFESIEKRDDLRALSDRTEASRLQDLASSSYWVPKVSLFGQYQYYNNISDIGSWNDYQNAYSIGVNLTWNLFDGLASISRTKETYEQYYQTDKTLTIARLRARQDFEMWKRKYIYFCSIYKSRLSDVEKTKENVRLAREGRRAGTRTNTDLLDAELDLFKAKAGVVNAQIGSIEALGNLELATGQELLKQSELR